MAGSMLADGTEPSGALSLRDPADRALAGRAGLARPVVNHQLKLKIPRRPIFTYKIAQGCSPAFNGMGQNLADGLRKHEVTFAGYAPRRPAWINPGKEKRFVGIDITHANNDVGAHNELLHADLAHA